MIKNEKENKAKKDRISYETKYEDTYSNLWKPVRKIDSKLRLFTSNAPILDSSGKNTGKSRKAVFSTNKTENQKIIKSMGLFTKSTGNRTSLGKLTNSIGPGLSSLRKRVWMSENERKKANEEKQKRKIQEARKLIESLNSQKTNLTKEKTINLLASVSAKNTAETEAKSLNENLNTARREYFQNMGSKEKKRKFQILHKAYMAAKVTSAMKKSNNPKK